MTGSRQTGPSSASRLGRGLLFCASLAASIAVLELALRLFDAPELRALHEVRSEEPWIYGLAPGAEAISGDGVHYAINAAGFRDHDYERPKPPNTFRVLVLGDSITFGYGVALESSYAKKLEQALDAARDPATEPRIEVLNLGVNGYNPYNEAALLESRGGEFEPDLVLVQFCINDLNDPSLHFAASAQLAMGALPEAAFPNPSKRRESSAFESACRRSGLCERALGIWLGGIAAPWNDRERITAYQPNLAPAAATEWHWLGERYADMARSAARTGANFAVVAMPYRDEMRPQRGDPRTPADSSLAALGRAGGFPTLSLIRAFRSAAAETPDPPLFTDLWHPSERGHQVAARALELALRCSGLVPRSRHAFLDACRGLGR